MQRSAQWFPLAGLQENERGGAAASHQVTCCSCCITKRVQRFTCSACLTRCVHDSSIVCGCSCCCCKLCAAFHMLSECTHDSTMVCLYILQSWHWAFTGARGCVGVLERPHMRAILEQVEVAAVLEPLVLRRSEVEAAMMAWGAAQLSSSSCYHVSHSNAAQLCEYA